MVAGSRVEKRKDDPSTSLEKAGFEKTFSRKFTPISKSIVAKRMLRLTTLFELLVEILMMMMRRRRRGKGRRKRRRRRNVYALQRYSKIQRLILVLIPGVQEAVQGTGLRIRHSTSSGVQSKHHISWTRY